MTSAKLKVRHILFKKIFFLIFLNDNVPICQTTTAVWKEKKKQIVFLAKACLTFNFAETSKIDNM